MFHAHFRESQKQYLLLFWKHVLEFSRCFFLTATPNVSIQLFVRNKKFKFTSKIANRLQLVGYPSQTVPKCSKESKFLNTSTGSAVTKYERPPFVIYRLLTIWNLVAIHGLRNVLNDWAIFVAHFSSRLLIILITC